MINTQETHKVYTDQKLKEEDTSRSHSQSKDLPQTQRQVEIEQKAKNDLALTIERVQFLKFRRPTAAQTAKFMPLIKTSALVNGILARQQTEFHSSPLSKDSKMVYKMVKHLKSNKSYQIFLLQRNIETLQSDDDVMYQIIVKDSLNSRDLYELDLSLNQSKEIFWNQNSTKAEVNEILIHFQSNKSEFIKMLNCITLSDDDELYIDFQKMQAQSMRIINDGKETFSQYESSKANDQDQTNILSSNRCESQRTNPEGNYSFMSEKNSAATKIQARVRGNQTRRRIMEEYGFLINDHDTKLSQYDRKIIRVHNLTLVLILYADKYREHLQMTMKEISSKQPIVHLHQVYLSMTEEGPQTLQELTEHVHQQINAECETLLSQDEDGANVLRQDWQTALKDFIEREL